jgi:hypothetical protein
MALPTLENPATSLTDAATTTSNFAVSPALRTAASGLSGANLPSRVFLLNLRLKSLGTSRKAPVALIETDAQPERVRLGKKILDCEELSEIKAHYQAIRHYIEAMSIPTGDHFRPGMYLMPYDLLSRVDKYLADAVDVLSGLVNDFVFVYEERIEDDRVALASLFDEANYPETGKVREAFEMSYEYLQMATAEGLKAFNADVYNREAEKLRKRIEEAAEESRLLIMEQAKDLAQNVCERLTADPATGKPRVFKESLLGNWNEFLETFSAKNITDDGELEALMNDIRAKLDGKTVADLRKNASVREEIRAHFEGVIGKLDGQMTAKPVRKMNLAALDEDSAAE